MIKQLICYLFAILIQASIIDGWSDGNTRTRSGTYLVDYQSLDGTEWIIRFKIEQNDLDTLKQATLCLDSNLLHQYTTIKQDMMDVGIQLALEDSYGWHQMQFSKRIDQFLDNNRAEFEIKISTDEIQVLRENLMNPENKAYYQYGLTELGRWDNRWKIASRPHLELELYNTIVPRAHKIAKRSKYSNSDEHLVPQCGRGLIYDYIIMHYALIHPVNIGSCAPPHSTRLSSRNTCQNRYRDRAARMCNFRSENFEEFSYPFLRANMPFNTRTVDSLSCVPIKFQIANAIGKSKSGRAQTVEIERVQACGCR